MIREEQLLEQRGIREQLVGRVEILEKVKELFLLPDINLATIRQVSNFYEVTEQAVKSLVFDNKDEIDSDGYKVWRAEDFNNSFGELLKINKYRGFFEVGFSNGDIRKFSPRGIALFPRRAILRVGMLLRDSKVAKEVRTQLLNIEEKTSNEIKIADINEEQKLAIEIGMNYAAGNLEQFAIASAKMMAFKNRHIDRLKQDNKALSESILTWEDRSKINRAMRLLSTKTRIPFGELWNNLYTELLYKFHINVKQRGNKPWIQHIKEDEWGCVVKSFSALCINNDVSPSEILDNIKGVQEVLM